MRTDAAGKSYDELGKKAQQMLAEGQAAAGAEGDGAAGAAAAAAAPEEKKGERLVGLGLTALLSASSCRRVAAAAVCVLWRREQCKMEWGQASWVSCASRRHAALPSRLWCGGLTPAAGCSELAPRPCFPCFVRGG